MFLRISNIALSLFLLLVTTGFSVSKHFCHDRLVDTVFFQEAESCHEIPESCCAGNPLPHCAPEINDDDCCKNESELVKFSAQFTLTQKEDIAKYSFNILIPSAGFERALLLSDEPLLAQLTLIAPDPAPPDMLALMQAYRI